MKASTARTALAWLLATQAPLCTSCGTRQHTERVEQAGPSTEAPPPSASAESTNSAPDTSGLGQALPAKGDPSILDILRTANTIAIRSARMARARSTNDAVQAYAIQIVADHTSANQQLSDLAKRLGVKPESNATSRALTANADHARAAFAAKSGTDFDRAYIENEIGFHRELLDLLERRLIPAVADSEVKVLLVTQRSTLESNLDHASHVQAKLAP